MSNLEKFLTPAAIPIGIQTDAAIKNMITLQQQGMMKLHLHKNALTIAEQFTVLNTYLSICHQQLTTYASIGKKE